MPTPQFHLWPETPHREKADANTPAIPYYLRVAEDAAHDFPTIGQVGVPIRRLIRKLRARDAEAEVAWLYYVSRALYEAAKYVELRRIVETAHKKRERLCVG